MAASAPARAFLLLLRRSMVEFSLYSKTLVARNPRLSGGMAIELGPSG